MHVKPESDRPLIIKSQARTNFAIIAGVPLEEECSLCDTQLPEGTNCLRHTETGYILCVPCLAEIARL